MDIAGAPFSSTKSKDSFPILDCDVHPLLGKGIHDLYPYMPEAWKQRFLRKNAEFGESGSTLRFKHPNGFVIRRDASPPSGGSGGADAKFLIADLIEPHGIEAVVLNCLQTSGMSAILAGIDESIVISAASNDHYIHEWLPLDKRLRLAMSVPTQDPLAAAAEIRRVGKHPQICAVDLALVNFPMGHRYWAPIYEAAQELDLPIFVHVTRADGVYIGAQAVAGGLPDSYVERFLLMAQFGESAVNSLVFSGTLEKFPRVKFIFAEYGFLWLLPLMWRMDAIWRELRHEVPWVKQSPIDTIHERFIFTTQPVEAPPKVDDLAKMIEMFGYDNLCFSSDYPHWDNDMPENTLRFIPSAERRKIFCENARGFLRLS